MGSRGLRGSEVGWTSGALEDWKGGLQMLSAKDTISLFWTMKLGIDWILTEKLFIKLRLRFHLKSTVTA